MVANSLASYTHDHQFSRLTRVDEVSGFKYRIGDDWFDVPASGRYNYVVVNGDEGTNNAECYHFIDGENGKEIWTHDMAGKQTVNGVEIDVENNMHIYLPFAQLFTGYGWGVNSAGINEYKGVIGTVTDGGLDTTKDKFAQANGFTGVYGADVEITLNKLFAATADGLATKGGIVNGKVQVFVSPANENSTVKGTYTANDSDWTQGTLKFEGAGYATVTITDYYFCAPKTVTVLVVGGDYYIAGYRDSESKYYYMTNNLGTASTKRYQAVYAGTTLPDMINSDDAEATKKFTFVAQADGTFKIKTGDNYLGWTSENNGILVDEAAANIVTLTLNENGTVKVYYAASDKDRYLALNNDHRYNYFAWYGGEKQDLTLIPIKACEHINTEDVAAKDATCTEAGNKAGVKCEDCGAIINGCDEITVLPHTEVIDAAVDATCTATGLTEGKHCSVCNTVIVAQKTTDKIVHIYVDGKCACGAVEPAAAKWVKTDLADIKSTDIVVITMTYKDGTVYALPNDKGTSTPDAVIVNVSGNTLTGNIADRLKWNIANNSESLTIYPNGVTNKWLYCTNSNSGVRVGNDDNKVFIIDASSGYLKHTGTNRYVGVYRTNPDWRCYTNTTGNTADQTLAFYVYKEGASSEEPGETECEHSYEEVVTTPATCTTDGVKTYTCSKCEDSYTEKIDKLLHTEVIDAEKPATCTSTGLTEGKHCSVCNTVIVAQEEVPTIDHTYGDDNTCDNCGYVKETTEPEVPVTETISFASTAQRKSQDGNSQVWKNDGITFTNNKASSTNAVANYSNPVRLYAGSSIVISASDKDITKIVFDCNSPSYATALKNSIGTVSGATVTVSSDKVTVAFTNAVDSFTITKLAAQVRLDSISVTYLG